MLKIKCDYVNKFDNMYMECYLNNVTHYDQIGNFLKISCKTFSLNINETNEIFKNQQ